MIAEKESGHNLKKTMKPVQIISRITPRMSKKELNEARIRYIEDRTLLWCCKIKRCSIEKFVAEYRAACRSLIANPEELKHE